MTNKEKRFFSPEGLQEAREDVLETASVRENLNLLQSLAEEAKIDLIRRYLRGKMSLARYEEERKAIFNSQKELVGHHLREYARDVGGFDWDTGDIHNEKAADDLGS